MKLLIHFLRLIRWPNLLFILLAECLFHFCIYKPLYPLATAEVDFRFYLMLVSNIFIAGAGYIINDYFDVNIDQINKPTKVVVGAFISRRWVIFWHLFLSVFARLSQLNLLYLIEILALEINRIYFAITKIIASFLLLIVFNLSKCY